jgi:hypothetical protein
MNPCLWWHVGSLDWALMVLIANSAAGLCIRFSNSASGGTGRIMNQANHLPFILVLLYNQSQFIAIIIITVIVNFFDFFD